MFLKRLEINGFKSFAVRTAFEFPVGIVAIVGPNGSGKSNIIDAFRWLLGEREAKNLRGVKAEDLIFAGTPKKPRMSMAQVSLTFDNADEKLPVDFKEVVISRKITRSGNSEYSINDSDVRLKDIIDFFSKIRLGSKGLTVIGQGAADIFITSSPQERMMMVQEILGLREYELKKNEAERKLKNTVINLDKVRAVMDEVLPRLRMLKRQTAKWERRAEIAKKLENLESDYFSFKFKQLVALCRTVREPLGGIQKELSALHAQREKTQQELAAVEHDVLPADTMKQLQHQKRELFEKKTQLERSLIKLEAAQEQEARAQSAAPFSADEAHRAMTNIREYLTHALAEPVLEGARKYIAMAKAVIDALWTPRARESSVSDTSARTEDLKKEIADVDERITVCEQQERELSHRIESFNATFRQVFERLEETKAQIKNREDELSRIRFEEEKIDYKVVELKHQVHAAGRAVGELEQRAGEAAFAVTYSDHELDEAERIMLRLRGELASIGDIDETLLKETRDVDAHHSFLKKESEDLVSAMDNLKTLIRELERTITKEFHASFRKVNNEFNSFFRIMFGGGFGRMKIVKREITVREGTLSEEQHPAGEEIEKPIATEDEEALYGIDVEVNIPQKKITSLEMLSGGERTLVSLAVLFALIAISPPPFLVLDEVDSALDEKNSRRFADLIKNYASHTQFVVVTHNRVTMEAADILYGVTMDESGVSRILSLRLEDKQPV